MFDWGSWLGLESCQPDQRTGRWEAAREKSEPPRVIPGGGMYPNGNPRQCWLTSDVPVSDSFEHVNTEGPVDAGRQTKGVDMAHIGEAIEHPLTGERLTFLETAVTTGGEFLKVSLEMAPGGLRATAPCPPPSRGTV